MLDLLTSIDRRLRYLDRAAPIFPRQEVVESDEPFALEEPCTDNDILVGLLSLGDESCKNNWAAEELTKILNKFTKAYQVWMKVNGEFDNRVFMYDGAICLCDPKTNERKVCVSHGRGPSSSNDTLKALERKQDGPVGSVKISFERLVGLCASFHPPRHAPSETFVCKPRSTIQFTYVEILDQTLLEARKNGLTVSRLEVMQAILNLHPEAAVAFYEIGTYEEDH